MSMEQVLTLTAQGWLAAAEMKVAEAVRQGDPDAAIALALQATSRLEKAIRELREKAPTRG